ncbi:hypothetical protein BGZ94_004396 [Podila epigama]|nr:hypothetical protein BGZ94_004396 [Podila epigama]
MPQVQTKLNASLNNNESSSTPAPLLLEKLDTDEAQGKDSLSSLPRPPPVPSKDTFYQTTINPVHGTPKRQATFLDSFFANHPKLSRHRRRFAALLFTIVTLLLILITVLSVTLTRKDSHEGGLGGSKGGDLKGVTTTTDEELARYNRGKTRPPINRSKDEGWARHGQGEGTFYDPSIKTSADTFAIGACEFEYVNSVKEKIAALNKPDFGSYARSMNSPACGQCIRVTGPNGTIDVQIVDMCPGCKSGDVDLSPGAFAEIAHLDKGRIKVSWEVCPN